MNSLNYNGNGREKSNAESLGNSKPAPIQLISSSSIPWVGHKDWRAGDHWRPFKESDAEDMLSSPCAPASSTSKAESSLVSSPMSPPANSPSPLLPSSSNPRTSPNAQARTPFGLHMNFNIKKWNKISPEPARVTSPPPTSTLARPSHPLQATTHVFYEDGSSWVNQKESRVDERLSSPPHRSPLSTRIEAVHPRTSRTSNGRGGRGGDSLLVASRQDAAADVASTLKSGMDHFHVVMAVAGDSSPTSPDGRNMSLAPRSDAYQQQRHSGPASPEVRNQGVKGNVKSSQESNASYRNVVPVLLKKVESSEVRDETTSTSNRASGIGKHKTPALPSPSAAPPLSLDRSFMSVKLEELSNREPGLSSDGGRGDWLLNRKHSKTWGPRHEETIEFTSMRDMKEACPWQDPSPRSPDGIYRTRPPSKLGSFMTLSMSSGPSSPPRDAAAAYAVGPEDEDDVVKDDLSSPLGGSRAHPDRGKKLGSPPARSVAVPPASMASPGYKTGVPSFGGEGSSSAPSAKAKAKTTGGGRPESSLFNRAGSRERESKGGHVVDTREEVEKAKYYGGKQIGESWTPRA